jgi:DNA repair exonuclease SbcCD ATPase subunit
MIENIEQARSTSETGRQWLDDLDRWRTFLHRSNYPKVITDDRMDQIADETNNQLKVFGSPFKVEANGELGFLATKPNGVVEEGNLLSKGERSVLAVSVRLAANSLFASDIGMICLDEPTEGLDEDNLGYFADAVKKLQTVTKKRGQQVIIITHDKRLSRVIDASIDLTK